MNSEPNESEPSATGDSNESGSFDAAGSRNDWVKGFLEHHGDAGKRAIRRLLDRSQDDCDNDFGIEPPV